MTKTLTGDENDIAQPKADRYPGSTSHFSPLKVLFCSWKKGIIPKIRMLCFVLINNDSLVSCCDVMMGDGMQVSVFKVDIASRPCVRAFGLNKVHENMDNQNHCMSIKQARLIVNAHKHNLLINSFCNNAYVCLY